MNDPIVMIFVTTRFVGFHRWLDAPEQYKYLREWHRHEFHVKLAIEVKGLNRDIEFIELKGKVDTYLRKFRNQHFEESCEHIAYELVSHFEGMFCTVSEDGENGSTVLVRNPYIPDEVR